MGRLTMIELRALGPLDLIGPAGAESPPQPKRLALLTFLAIAHPHGFHSRDSLAALFWPDLDRVRARAALRSAVHAIRSTAGEVVVSRGDTLGLNEEAVWCDARKFDSAIELGDLERSLEFYRGPLLDGFHLSGSAEFERWLELERKRYRDRARDAALTLSDRCAEHGNVNDSVAWARRAVEICGLEERAVRRLIERLDLAGDRAAAIRAYEVFADRLADDLDLEPSPETRAIVDAIRARDEIRTSTVVTGGEEPQSPVRASVGEPRPARPSQRWPALTKTAGLLGGAFIALSILVAGVLLGSRSNRDSIDTRAVRELNPQMIAVFPFRVSAIDPSYEFLREGMVDLVAARLRGRNGPWAVEPGAVIAAWQKNRGSEGADGPTEKAGEVARSFGAGRILLGSAVGTARELVLNASMLNVDGERLAETSVTGPPDSLLVLVDALVATLLAEEAGEPESWAASIARVNLAAARAYLDGQQAYRQGRYPDAVRYFGMALDRDSTFALAGLRLASAAWWTTGAEYPSWLRGVMTAWASREALGPRDLVLLEAWVGQQFPRPTSVRGKLAGWDRAIQSWPDQPEPWHESADRLFHEGKRVGLVDPWTQAEARFRRAIELAPSFAPSLDHLIELYLSVGDTTSVGPLWERYLTLDFDTAVADYLRWRIAHSRQDETATIALRKRFPEMDTRSLWRIIGTAQLEGFALDDADAAAAVVTARAAASTDQGLSYIVRHRLAMNRGRLGEALRIARAWADIETQPHSSLRMQVLDALYWDGDREAAVAAVERLRVLARRGESDAGTRLDDLCVIAQWDLWARTVSDVGDVVKLLLAPRQDRDANHEPRTLCAAILRATQMTLSGDAMATRVVDRLDSLLVAGVVGSGYTSPYEYGCLVEARLRESLGDLEGALAAVRRRTYQWLSGTLYLSSYLRREGHLAMLTGDRKGAIEAYQHFLALRSNADPSLRSDVARVRDDLAELLEQ